MGTKESGESLFHVASVPAKGRVIVLGVGGAGCNAVARMRGLWTEGPECVALDTDAQVVSAAGGRRGRCIGGKVTEGLSAGGDVTAGRLAAEEHAAIIQENLAGYDVVFLVAGLGGGTGTGAAPVIAREARRLGLVTIAFATMPFPFEGDRRRLTAEEGLRNLQNTADTVICMPNQRLFELLGANTPVPEAFLKADEMVAAGIHAIWSLLSHTGVINLDLADIRELAQRSQGGCAFGYSETRGPARAAKALAGLLNSPMLEKGRLLAEASGLLVNITAGPDLTLADVQGIMGQIAQTARPGARLFMGALIDPAYRERLALTVLASENWLEARRAADPGEGNRVMGAEEAPTAAPQEQLAFVTPDRGMFDKGEPTLFLGQDLDIPTYVRRGIKLPFD